METGAEDKNQQTAIYVMTHKAFTPPPERKVIEAYDVWKEKKNYGKVSMGVVSRWCNLV